MDSLTQFMQLPLFRNSMLEWSIALATAAAIYVALVIARSFVRRSHRKLLVTPKTELFEIPLEVLSRTTSLFFLIVSLFIGLGTLTMSSRTAAGLRSALIVAIFFQTGVWAAAAATGWLTRRRRKSASNDQAVQGSLGVIGFVVQAVIWALVLLLMLDNLGVDVTALVAGLGIGGIAVALAVQNILGDLFASLSITFDKPFALGDFLIVDDFLGAVEHIGLKSTRLRSLGGEQIILSNADLLKSRVRNYGRMSERRIVFTHNVTYETSAQLLERIPAIVRGAIEKQRQTRFDRCHFARHGAASLDFESVYYVLSADYNRYMDIQQAINLEVHREFAKLGIEFAYPTQKIFLAEAEAGPATPISGSP